MKRPYYLRQSIEDSAGIGGACILAAIVLVVVVAVAQWWRA